MPIDQTTIVTFVGGAMTAGKVAEKILGPTAELVGNGLRNWTQRGANNVERIFAKASKRLGDAINHPGGVPPKVLKEILDNGAFAEDELAASYFGGVLASSRTTVSRDDRGAAFAQLVARLTTYELRLHYVLYTLFRRHFLGSDRRVGTADGRSAMWLLLRYEEFLEAMDFTPEEPLTAITGGTLAGLSRESLIGETWEISSVDEIRKRYPAAETGGLLVNPTHLGADLFLWASGHGNYDADCLVDPKLSFEELADVRIPSHAIATNDVGDARV